jgi:hypothetical protein
MRSLASRPPNVARPKPTPRYLPQTAPTAPNLPRTRALAKAKLMFNQPGWRRAVHPTAPATQLRPAGVQQGQLQHISTLQARVHALENHVDALNKSLGRWDPETWECLREMFQELCEGNSPTEGET